MKNLGNSLDGESDKEPLATLARVRRFADGQVHFGYNLVALDPSRKPTLRVGDEVEVTGFK